MFKSPKRHHKIPLKSNRYSEHQSEHPVTDILCPHHVRTPLRFPCRCGRSRTSGGATKLGCLQTYRRRFNCFRAGRAFKLNRCRQPSSGRKSDRSQTGSRFAYQAIHRGNQSLTHKGQRPFLYLLIAQSTLVRQPNHGAMMFKLISDGAAV